MLNLSYIATGLLMGAFAGFFGLGGGFILIPILVFFYGLSQHQAQGTSLAVMLPPITLLAVLRYYKSGNVKVGMAVLIAAGFMLGGLVGAEIVHHVPETALKKIFGITLLFVSLRLIFIQ